MSSFLATAVLDSQALSLWIRNDREFATQLQVLHSTGTKLVIGANTIIEVAHAKVNLPQLRWVLSQVRVEPVTKQAAMAAAELLRAARIHGHKHAIDATVGELALRQTGPVAVFTSDRDDFIRLCGSKVQVIRV